MLSEKNIMEMIQEYKMICALIDILKITISEGLDSNEDLFKKKENYIKKKQLIDIWMELLAPKERFVIKMHLIEGLDWKETEEKYTQEVGMMNAVTIRSLKRMQSRALKRIAECMNESS